LKERISFFWQKARISGPEFSDDIHRVRSQVHMKLIETTRKKNKDTGRMYNVSTENPKYKYTKYLIGQMQPFWPS